MNNLEIADIFKKIANLLEIKGDEKFKINSYRRAAENILSLAEDINLVHREKRLTDIPGIGKAISTKIIELLTTGKLDFLERLENEVPASLLEILDIPEVGAKKAALFWKQAGITTLAELKTAASQGRLRNLPGMGEKSEARILAGIDYLTRSSQAYGSDIYDSTRVVLANILPVAEFWLEWLRSFPEVNRAEIAGSIRRQCTTSGDIDLVAASTQPQHVMQKFTSHPDVRHVTSLGERKSSIELQQGIKMQLWIQPPERFGSLWQFATGSKNHNVRLRELAQKQGLSLSEYGFRDEQGNEILCSSEEEVYNRLSLPWIEPELREDRGEIKAAQTGSLPELITTSHMKSDLHCHSTWSDGKDTIRQLAQKAPRLGLKVLAITDHSKGLGIAGGLSIEQLRLQRQEMQEFQKEMGDSIILLQGSEVDIRASGDLDYPDDILATLDIIVASIHASIHQPRQVITERLIKTMRNPHVHIIGHPSSRLIHSRLAADLDWEAVFNEARENNVALEINSDPYRMDLDENLARRAVEKGVLLSINTDAHSSEHLDQARFGAAVARRAWVEPENVINTWQPDRLLKWLKQK